MKKLKEHWFAIVLIIFMIIYHLLILSSCGKHEVIDVQPEPHTYTVRYFANGDSNFVRYNIDSTYIKNFFVHFDTTFQTRGGWLIDFHVTAFDFPMNAGVIVDGEVIDNCSNVEYFCCQYYLH